MGRPCWMTWHGLHSSLSSVFQECQKPWGSDQIFFLVETNHTGASLLNHADGNFEGVFRKDVVGVTRQTFQYFSSVRPFPG